MPQITIIKGTKWGQYLLVLLAAIVLAYGAWFIHGVVDSVLAIGEPSRPHSVILRPIPELKPGHFEPLEIPVQLISYPTPRIVGIIEEIAPPIARVEIDEEGFVRVDDARVATILEVPPAPHGGRMLVSIDEEGEVRGTFLPNPKPSVEFFPERHLGLVYDTSPKARIYAQQDVVRIKNATIGVGSFLDFYPDGRNGGVDFGGSVSVRWSF